MIREIVGLQSYARMQLLINLIVALLQNLVREWVTTGQTTIIGTVLLELSLDIQSLRFTNSCPADHCTIGIATTKNVGRYTLANGVLRRVIIVCMRLLASLPPEPFGAVIPMLRKGQFQDAA